MSIYNLLTDIVRTTKGLGIAAVKISGDNSDGKITVEASQEENRFIAKAHTLVDIPEIDCVFGLSDLAKVSGILTATSKYDATKVDAELIKRTDGTPFEILITAEDDTDNYRVLAPSAIQRQPVFKGANWSVSIPLPSKDVIDRLAARNYLAEKTFTLEAKDDGILKINLGDDTSNRATVVFAFNIGATLKKTVYPVAEFLGVLKVATPENAVIKISNQGIMMIQFQTNLVDYSFIFPEIK